MSDAVPSLLVPDPADSHLQASVIIPAKNEGNSLAIALEALRDQSDLNGDPLARNRYEVIVLSNNSTDHTAAVAHVFKRSHPSLIIHVVERFFEPAQAHIGHVRRILMEEACRRLESSSAGTRAILSTDADTKVMPDWIAQNLRELERGADAVGGHITLDRTEDSLLSPRATEMHRLDTEYRTLVAWLEDRIDPQAHDRWPRHYHHFGASLAVTPAAYREVGGLPPERQLEDIAFFGMLIRHDKKFRHSPAVKIQTSPRLQGRTRVGLAEQLAQWESADHLPEQTLVDSVTFLRSLFDCRRRFRILWQTGIGYSEFVEHTKVAPERLQQAIMAVSFGMAWEQLDVSHQEHEKQPLELALTELRSLFTAESATPAPSPVSSANQSDTAPAARSPR